MVKHKGNNGRSGSGSSNSGGRFGGLSLSFSYEFFDGFDFDLAWLDFELGLGWIFQWWCWWLGGVGMGFLVVLLVVVGGMGFLLLLLLKVGCREMGCSAWLVVRWLSSSSGLLWK